MAAVCPAGPEPMMQTFVVSCSLAACVIAAAVVLKREASLLSLVVAFWGGWR